MAETIEPLSEAERVDALDALPDLTPIHIVNSVFAGERMEMVVEPFGD